MLLYINQEVLHGMMTSRGTRVKNTCNAEPYMKLLRRVEDALEEKPINKFEIFKVAIEISSPTFKYPNLQKCSKNCQAEETNKRLYNALNKLKELSRVDDEDEIVRMCGIARLLMEGSME